MIIPHFCQNLKSNLKEALIHFSEFYCTFSYIALKESSHLLKFIEHLLVTHSPIQPSSWVPWPSHSFPPPFGAGELQTLTRLTSLETQGSHFDHSPHSDQPPSTASTKTWNYSLSIAYIFYGEQHSMATPFYRTKYLSYIKIYLFIADLISVEKNSLQTQNILNLKCTFLHTANC